MAFNGLAPACQCHSCTGVQKLDTVLPVQSCKCLSGWESPLPSSVGCTPGSTLLNWLLFLPTHATESCSTHCPPDHSSPFLKRCLFFFPHITPKYIIVAPVPIRKLRLTLLNFMKSFQAIAVKSSSPLLGMAWCIQCHCTRH